MIDLARLNTCTPAQFVAELAAIFEHSPWVAARAASRRPFRSRLHLLDAMRAVVAAAPPDEQLRLIRAHPQLGSGARQPADLTAASAREQRRAGLQACTPRDYARLDELNTAYLGKFAMPFILAVRGHDPASIIACCEMRLTNTVAAERQTALHEIGLIAGYRLADGVTSPLSAEVPAMHQSLGGNSGQGVAAPAAVALVREWLLAADLDLFDTQSHLTGRRRGVGSHPKTLLMAVFDVSAATMPCGNRSLGFLVALAVLQEFRQRGIRLRDDLLVMVQTPTHPAGTPPNLAAEAAATVLEPPAWVADEIALEASALEHRARAWEDFLLTMETP